jgi:inositol phosphorylceramide mannosyltransferase catalytic subunit
VIPRIVHQIWLGRDPLPDEFKGYVKTWKQHHPKWEHRLWTEENLPSDTRRPYVHERIRHPAERSDMLRLELLWQYGGLYVDTDFECLRPLDPHIGDAEFFTAWLKPPAEGKSARVNNAFMGAVPGHPLIDKALDELQPQEWFGFDKNASGALFFNRLVKDFPDILVLPAELIYPNSPETEASAVTIHHSARSWKDAEGFRQAAVRAEKRLREARGALEKERKAHAKTKRRLEEAEAERDRARSGGRERLRLPKLRSAADRD